MNCGCEHGMKCSKVSVCFMEDRVAQEKHDLEATIADLRERHEAFVQDVKEDATRAEGYLSLDGPKRNWLAFSAAQRILALCDAELKGEAQ